jgi:Zn-finger nucleic acid-binding protein
MSSFAPGMPEPETAVRYLRCPRCRDIMGRHLIVRGSNVIVDRCARHGVWFDAHELRRLAELTAHHHAEVRYPPEPPAPADDLLDLQTRRAVAAALVRPIGAHDRGTLLATLFEVLLRRRGG